jgi:hypothetical protein
VYNLGPIPKEVAKDYLDNRISENRFQLKCQIVSPINERVQVGDVILITFLTTSPTTEDEKIGIDETVWGYWIVESITDEVSNGKGGRLYTLIKDSFFNISSSSDMNRKERLPQVESVLKGE